MLVPMLAQCGFDVALLHVEEVPVHPGARFTDKCAESDVEMGAFLLAAVDAVSIERVLDQELLDQVGLLSWLALHDHQRRWHFRRWNEFQIRVRWQVTVRLLVRLRRPRSSQVFCQLATATFEGRDGVGRGDLRLGQLGGLVLWKDLGRGPGRCGHLRVGELLRLVGRLLLGLEADLLELTLDLLGVGLLLGAHSTTACRCLL